LYSGVDSDRLSFNYYYIAWHDDLLLFLLVINGFLLYLKMYFAVFCFETKAAWPVKDHAAVLSRNSA